VHRCLSPAGSVYVHFSGGSAYLTSVVLHSSFSVQLAFYDIALAGVKDCQEMCKAACIPFERPKDYYAEMVKTDEHMLKVSPSLPNAVLTPLLLNERPLKTLRTWACRSKGSCWSKQQRWRPRK